jgi:hypothetical protein
VQRRQHLRQAGAFLRRQLLTVVAAGAVQVPENRQRIPLAEPQYQAAVAGRPRSGDERQAGRVAQRTGGAHGAPQPLEHLVAGTTQPWLAV